MIYLFYSIHVLICLFLILVVLLQQGKGADLSVFGGGSTMTAFGARGAATLLHKMTVIGFVAFILTTMAIGVLEGHREGSSVMSGLEASAEAPAADASEPVPATGEAEESEPVGALAEDEPDVVLPEAEEFSEPPAEADEPVANPEGAGGS